ncbi:MAG: glycosyltransferase family 4 protein [Candidatus Woesearchaeota archaeon]
MRVLMFGWEFPPLASGGLGTACYGLARGLRTHGVKLTFVMPKVPEGVISDRAELVSAAAAISAKVPREGVVADEVIKINSLITPYLSYDEYLERKAKYGSLVDEFSLQEGSSNKSNDIYGKDLYSEVWRYRQRARLVALTRDFDVIHCHDWLTYGAGIEAKKATGKPLVMHIHATEFDRTGDNPNQYVYNLEKEGFEHADKILAVSNFTKNRVVTHYGIDPSKIEVVHNAVEWDESEFDHPREQLSPEDKVVLFLGRITVQKGPDWFLYAAKMVAEHYPNVKFIVSGSGDMESFMISKAAELGLGDKVLFTGFLRGKDIDRAYRMADLYVMPSISEPFGITPLEAMRNGTPVLISKQSGVSEVIKNCLRTDFWDVHDMANKMLAALQYPALHTQLQETGKSEVKTFSWDEPARKCVNAYHTVLQKHRERQNQLGTHGHLEGNLHGHGFHNQRGGI